MTPRAEEDSPAQLRTASAEDTRALGASLAGGLRPGDVVLLAGDLGSGKTTLAQGIAAGLGVTDNVTSPTFTLVRSYPLPVPAIAGPRAAPGPHPEVRTFIHADLYRLERVGEVIDLALAELVEDDAVAVVEWGDVAGPVLGRDSIGVVLSPGRGDDDRFVMLSVPLSWGPRRAELAASLSKWAVP